MGTGDQIRLVGEVTPGATGSNSAQSAWNTFYTVPGMRVSGVAFLQNVNGNYVQINPLDTDAAYNGTAASLPGTGFRNNAFFASTYCSARS